MPITNNTRETDTDTTETDKENIFTTNYRIILNFACGVLIGATVMVEH